MKKLLLAALIMGLNSCYSYNETPDQYRYISSYKMALKKAAINGSEQKLDEGRPMAFDSADLDFFSILMRIGFVWMLKNKTSKTIKIIWDESTFLLNGNPDRVISSSMAIADKNRSVPPSIVPAGVTLKESLVPASTVYFYTSSATRYSRAVAEWRTRGILPRMYSKSNEAHLAEFRKLVEAFDKKELLDIMLAIEINGEKKEYFFDFHMPEAKVIQLDNLKEKDVK